MFAHDLRARTVRALSMDERPSLRRQSQDAAGPEGGEAKGAVDSSSSAEGCDQDDAVSVLVEDLVQSVERGLGQEPRDWEGTRQAATSGERLSSAAEAGSGSGAGFESGPPEPEPEPESSRPAADDKLPRSASFALRGSHSSPSPKFVSFKEGMPEYVVQKKVRSIIFDDSSPEGNTRKIFVESFAAASAASRLLDLRHFIDGMHSHFIEHRGTALCLLYEQERQSFLINSPKYSEMGNLDFLKVLDSNSRDAADSKFRMDSKMGSYKLFKEKLLLAEVDERVLAFVSFVVFMVVEEAMFLPLKEDIYRMLPSFGNEVSLGGALPYA